MDVHRSSKLDLPTRFAILILMLIIFLSTLSMDQASRFRRMVLNSIAELSSTQAYNSSALVDHFQSEIPQDQLRLIVNAVNHRKYSRARSRLMRMGFSNPRISKRGDLILIYHDKGKLVIDSKDLRILG